MVNALASLGTMTAVQFLPPALQQKMHNVGAAKYLSLKVAFPHPVTGSPVFLIDDFPHAIKKVSLARKLTIVRLESSCATVCVTSAGVCHTGPARSQPRCRW